MGNEHMIGCVIQQTSKHKIIWPFIPGATSIAFYYNKKQSVMV